jgi:hypothetical protein
MLRISWAETQRVSRAYLRECILEWYKIVAENESGFCTGAGMDREDRV